jgi:signal transduction histidine kinase
MQGVPLLVVRLPELERVAWRKGRRAARALERRSARVFSATASRMLRREDVIAHDDGDRDFLIALSAPARDQTSVALPTDCRATLARLASAMQSATELPVQTGWTIIDATRELRLEALVEEALDRGAREQERYKFFSTIGHELRTPLTSIRGYIETILHQKLDERTQRSFLETIATETNRLSRLVDGLFEISLLESQSVGGRELFCDSERALAQAVRVVEPIAAHRTAHIEYQPGESAAVAIDEDRLVQVVVNLLENAVKHGREGGHIVVSSHLLSDRYFEIVVDDDGMGIPEDERERIFALSERGSRATGKGTGIGLAVARLLVERINGEIDVVVSPLGGARFRIRLPLIFPDAQALPDDP